MMTHDDNGDGDVVTRVASVYSSTQIARHRNRMQLLQQSDSECSDDESVKSASEHNNQDLDINIRIFENENSVQTNITGEILCKLKNNIENKTAAVKFDSDYDRFHSSTDNGTTPTTVGGSSRTNFKVIFNANFENCINDNGIVNIDHLRTLIQAGNGGGANFVRSPVKEANCITETLLRFTDKTNDATSVPTKTLNAAINGQPAEEDIFDINDIGMALLSRKNLMKKRTTSAMVKLKREYQRKAKEANHETTMVDLIFYNPPSSMTSSMASDNNDSSSNKTASLEEEEKVVATMTTTTTTAAKLETLEPKSEQRDDEEIVDDPAEMEEDLDDEVSDDSEMKEESITGVPQLIVDADGNIVIDTKSLRVESTVSSKSKRLIARNGVVFEEGRTMQPRMKKRAYTKPWSATDTLKFYMLLNTFTTDFTQIAEFFKDRTRNCIKRKYKKEEKSRPQLVEKALRANSSFNVDQLKEELSIFDKIKRLKTGDSSSSSDTPAASAQRSRGRKKKNIVSDELVKFV